MMQSTSRGDNPEFSKAHCRQKTISRKACYRPVQPKNDHSKRSRWGCGKEWRRSLAAIMSHRCAPLPVGVAIPQGRTRPERSYCGRDFLPTAPGLVVAPPYYRERMLCTVGRNAVVRRHSRHIRVVPEPRRRARSHLPSACSYRMPLYPVRLECDAKFRTRSPSSQEQDGRIWSTISGHLQKQAAAGSRCHPDRRRNS